MNDLLFLLIFLVMIVGMKLKVKDYYMDYLDLRNTKKLKGIFALVIVGHHLSQKIHGTLFHTFFYMGILAVGIFFFLSGYGLMVQFMSQNQNYLDNFFRKRMVSIALPYLIANVVYMIGYNLTGKETSWKDLFIGFTDGDPMVRFSWFVITLMLFYVFFYVSARIFQEFYHLIIMNMMLLAGVYSIWCDSFSFQDNWYNTWLAFVFGMIWALNGDVIKNAVTQKYVKWTMIITGGLFGIYVIKFLELNYMKNGLAGVCLDQICVILFCAWICIISLKIRFGNKVLFHLGEVSYEIYLYQGLILYLLDGLLKVRSNEWVYGVFTYLFTFLLATIMKGISSILSNWIGGNGMLNK